MRSGEPTPGDLHARAVSALAKFTVEQAGEDYLVHVENDGGETMQLRATSEQIELIADTLDEILGTDDALNADDAEEKAA